MFATSSGGSPRVRAAVALERQLRDDRQVARRLDRQDRLAQLGDVRERLEDQQVDAAFEQRLRLLADRRAHLPGPHVAGRRQHAPGRPDGARDEHRVAVDLARVARQPRRLEVDVAHLRFQPVPRQPEAVRAERVRLDDVRARRDVVLVHAPHEVRLVEHQRLEAGVLGDAAAVQQRAHRAIGRAARAAPAP